MPFSHAKHQRISGNCNLCHLLFPQSPGAVEKMKAVGKLDRKGVMEQCKKCHKERSQKGEWEC
ncbi:MAG: hypothetical protein JW883_12525 [Deltaproteobacteria bacterium]|nr:hypothetical protein [Deltaproteobacteria bacterium]